MQKKWLGLVLGLMILLVLVIGYLWAQIKNTKATQNLKPVFSKQYATVAGQIKWELRNFQPIIKDFKQEDGRKLIIVEWPDKFGEKRTAKLAVPETADTTVFKKGEQVRVEYINVVPEWLDVNDCDGVIERLRLLCLQTRILADQQFKLPMHELLQLPEYSPVEVAVVSLSKQLYED